jgi:hypothetical protein
MVDATEAAMGAGGNIMSIGALLRALLGALAAMPAVWLAGAGPVRAGADMEPVIVVPGRPGVPIMIDGQDVSGAVIEGEWGLGRGHTGHTIIQQWPTYQWRRPAAGPPPAGGYFPGTGQRPAYGRLEVIPPPNRALPRKAEQFNRVWTSESAPLPATIEPPYAMPPVILGPRAAPDAGQHGLRPRTPPAPPPPRPPHMPPETP